jgi:hypothetical protein
MMAIVRKLEPITLEVYARHTEVNCTYSIIVDKSDEKYLQIGTYGSKKRKIPGKKSQSIRFSHEAIKQLKSIIGKEL